MRWIGLLLALLGAVFTLAACNGTQEAVQDVLPLDDERPTLLLFYADN